VTSAAFAERKCFLMKHMSHQDEQKEEVCSEKRRDQHQLLSVSQPMLGEMLLFHLLHEFLPAKPGKTVRKNVMTPVPLQLLGMSTPSHSLAGCSLLWWWLIEDARHPLAPNGKNRFQHLLLQSLEISFLQRLEAFQAICALPLLLAGSVLFALLGSFPSSGVSSLLFTLLGFAVEDTPVLFVCLQLFHTPQAGYRS
jgi:hypothetical protein